MSYRWLLEHRLTMDGKMDLAADIIVVHDCVKDTKFPTMSLSEAERELLQCAGEEIIATERVGKTFLCNALSDVAEFLSMDAACNSLTKKISDSLIDSAGMYVHTLDTLILGPDNEANEKRPAFLKTTVNGKIPEAIKERWMAGNKALRLIWIDKLLEL